MSMGDLGTMFEKPIDNLFVTGFGPATQRCFSTLVYGIDNRAQLQHLLQQGFRSTRFGGDMQRRHFPFLSFVDVALSSQEKHGNLPLPVLECEAEWQHTVNGQLTFDRLINVSACIDVLLNGLEVSRGNGSVQTQLGARACTFVPQELSDIFLLEPDREIQGCFV